MNKDWCGVSAFTPSAPPLTELPRETATESLVKFADPTGENDGPGKAEAEEACAEEGREVDGEAGEGAVIRDDMTFPAAPWGTRRWNCSFLPTALRRWDASSAETPLRRDE